MKRFMTLVLAGIACLTLTSLDSTSVALAGGGAGDCVGDVDGDGHTGILDFFAVYEALGQDCSETPCDADVDGDGMVGVGDFLAVLMDFGCGVPTCTSNDQCDDGDDCTYDLCLHGTCINIPICWP